MEEQLLLLRDVQLPRAHQELEEAHTHHARKQQELMRQPGKLQAERDKEKNRSKTLEREADDATQAARMLEERVRVYEEKQQKLRQDLHAAREEKIKDRVKADKQLDRMRWKVEEVAQAEAVMAQHHELWEAECLKCVESERDASEELQRVQRDSAARGKALAGVVERTELREFNLVEELQAARAAGEDYIHIYLFVCLFVCMYVRTYVRMYVIYACMYVCNVM